MVHSAPHCCSGAVHEASEHHGLQAVQTICLYSPARRLLRLQFEHRRCVAAFITTGCPMSGPEALCVWGEMSNAASLTVRIRQASNSL